MAYGISHSEAGFRIALALRLFHLRKFIAPPKGFIIDSMTFKYRRKITITEQSGNNLSDYQVRIDLDASNFDFSHFLNGGKDLRFTDINGNLLPYWVEKMDIAAQEATIWVKVPSIPANSSVDIFMYYGNSSVDSVSSGTNVFAIFDDFEVLTQAWKDYDGNPVLKADNPSFDVDGATDPCVIKEGDTYKMWYWCRVGTSWNICYATSTDGINWTKHGIVFSGACRPCVLKVGDTYYMYYNNKDENAIGLATSTDGINWTDHGIVLSITEPYEGSAIFNAWVIYDEDEGIWKMWYAADEYFVPEGWHEPKVACYATSNDGINWTKYAGNPIIEPSGNPFDWWCSAVANPVVKKINGKYYATIHAAGEDGRFRVGFIESDDGINWSIKRSDLILNLGDRDTWNNRHLYGRGLVYENGIWKRWYNARADSSPPEETGYAEQKSNVEILDASKWIKMYYDNKGFLSISNSELVFNFGGDGSSWYSSGIRSHYEMPTTFEARIWVRWSLNTDANAFFFVAWKDSNNWYQFDYESRYDRYRFNKNIGGTASWGVVTYSSADDSLPLTEFRVRRLADGTWRLYKGNDLLIETVQTELLPPFVFHCGMSIKEAAVRTVAYDRILVRKYIDPEPSVSVGNEETA